MQNLVVTTPGFLAFLCACTLVAAVFSARRWHRRRWLSATLTTVATLTLALASTADFVNAHYEYVPQVRDVADIVVPGVAYPRVSTTVAMHPTAHPAHPGGVVRLALPNGHDGLGTSHALVYLPAAYFRDPTMRFPVVYLIHGTPGSPEDWFRAAHAASVGHALERAGTPAVLVAPVMSKGWTDDSECVDGRTEQVESHLLDVVLPTVEQHFRVRTDRGGRILAGNSAGGYCALNLGLRNRGLFGTIDDLSGYTKPTFDAGMAKLFGTTLTPTALAADVRNNTPAVYAPTLPAGPATRIWLDSGRSDKEVLREETAMAAELHARTDTPTVLVTQTGGHTYAVWRAALRTSLLWAVAGVGPSPSAILNTAYSG